MISFRLGLHGRALGIAVAGVLAMAGCPSDDSGDDTETIGATTMPTTTSPGTDTMGDDSSSGAAGLSHATDIQPIWTMTCAAMTGCHEAGSTFPPELAEGSAYDAIVDVMSPTTDLLIVAPEDPEGSYLWHKINNTHLDVGGAGSPMPLIGMLPQSDIDMITEWIEQGALP